LFPIAKTCKIATSSLALGKENEHNEYPYFQADVIKQVQFVAGLSPLFFGTNFGTTFKNYGPRSPMRTVFHRILDFATPMFKHY